MTPPIHELSRELAVTVQRVKANEARMIRMETAVDKITRRLATWNGALMVAVFASPFLFELIKG